MSDIEKNDVETDVEKVEAVVENENENETVNEENNDIVVENVEITDSATVIEPEKDDTSLIIEVKQEDSDNSSKKDKKNKKKKNKKGEEVTTEVVEVTNIPDQVVTTKESKKSKKFVSFVCFSTIVLALVFSIVDWVLASVTKNPVINLHLMQWIVIILYIFIAAKALPFLNGKKKWVKALYWICVISTLVCILVPMIMDYVNLSKLIEAQNDTAKAASLLYMLA